ncbi:MAG: hypothetical protein LBN23_01890 [Paludibacter sp.]|jgi:hypothetical protein|nr:hypothetical protein [Paludibacter sp.]
MKKIIFSLLAVFVFSVANAQTPRFINAELLGVYNLVGVSFDSRFSANSHFGYKVGLGYGYEKSKYTQGWMYEFGGRDADFRTSPIGYLRNLLLQNVVSLPLNVYYLTGKNSSHFELGLGVTPYYADFQVNESDGLGYYAFLQTAYRYEGKKILFSAGIDIPFKTPGSDFEQAIGLYPKISIGYRL